MDFIGVWADSVMTQRAHNERVASVFMIWILLIGRGSDKTESDDLPEDILVDPM
jgi:hypothetical protein